MSGLQVKGGRELSRDELKQILFGWLHSKGILGELQAFLRVKMVEKLNETTLSPTLVNGSLTLKEHAMNLVIYEFLKQRQMHYTLSVFASECASIRQCPNVNETQIRKQIADILNIHTIVNSHSHKSRKDGTSTILDILIDVCTNMCGKTYESKSSQYLDSQFQKLMIHTQIQTEAEKTLSIVPTNSITTQTQLSVEHSDDVSSVKALNEEIVQLRRQLDESITALSACQRQLQETKEKTSQLAAVKLRDPLKLVDTKAVEFPPAPAAVYPSNYLLDSLTARSEDIYFERRIQEARQFLNGLDHRLDNLERKYQRATTDPERVHQDDDLPDEGKISIT